MATDTHYVISHRGPYQWFIVILAVIVITASIQWYVNRVMNADQIEKLSMLKQQHNELKSQYDAMLSQNQSMTVQIKDQTQMLAMNSVTDQQLRADLQELQEKVIELNKELLFYQNITQGTASSELQIRELHLRVVPESIKTYHYRIVITQGQKITKAIKGDINVMLSSSGEQVRVINQHPLKLRHVQVLEGTIKLDENEVPDHLFIELKQGKKTLAERTFKWDVEHSDTL